MALNANALVATVDAESALQIPTGTATAVLEMAINGASAALERLCQRPLKQAQYTTIRMRGPKGQRLWPQAVPISVTDAVTVTIDGIAQTVWRVEADGDPAAFDVMVASSMPEDVRGANDHLYRSAAWGGGAWRTNPYNVVLTFKGGFLTVPSDLQQACLDIVAKLYRENNTQLREVVALNMPGGSITILDTDIPRRARTWAEGFRHVAV